jgi:hypothetical protein
LKLDHQINQLVLAQKLQISAIHAHMDSEIAAPGKGNAEIRSRAPIRALKMGVGNYSMRHFDAGKPSIVKKTFVVAIMNDHFTSHRCLARRPAKVTKGSRALVHFAIGTSGQCATAACGTFMSQGRNEPDSAIARRFDPCDSVHSPWPVDCFASLAMRSSRLGRKARPARPQ